MPKLVCADFEQFVAGLKGLQGQYILRTAQTEPWILRAADLRGVTVMMGSEGAGRLYNGTGQDNYFHVFLVLGDRHRVTVDGANFDSRQFAWVMPDRMFHTCTEGPIRWLNISVSVDNVTEWARAHENEFDLRLLRRSLRLPLHRSPETLLSLATLMVEAEECVPHRLHSPSAESSARNEILDTMFRTVLPATSAAHARQFNARRMRILERVLELLRVVDYATLQTKDLYEAAGVSERTLRDIFNEYFGMSPHRYVMLHRLHEIRSAIHGAAPGDTITTICARFGVWDFGRLAKLYRSYFGLLPSQSLHKCGTRSGETKTVSATAAWRRGFRSRRSLPHPV